METLAPRGAVIAASLLELSARASRYVGQVAETAIPEEYPTQMSPLYGGDWRRVIYDVRQLRTLVPVLGVRICRSSPVAERLGGGDHCSALIEQYLYSQVGERWDDSDPAPEPAEDAPPGVDQAYTPFATAVYESCELTPDGRTVPYQKRLLCLQRVLREPARKLADAGATGWVRQTREYLKATCELESAAGVSLDNPMARPMLSKDECEAVGSVRAMFFIESWTAARPEWRRHLQARVSWGRRIEKRLPELKTRLERALRSPPPGTDASFAWTPTHADLELARNAIETMLERAKNLATSQCATAAAAELGAECGLTIERYWLSYAYVPGMRWDGEVSE